MKKNRLIWIGVIGLVVLVAAAVTVAVLLATPEGDSAFSQKSLSDTSSTDKHDPSSDTDGKTTLTGRTSGKSNAAHGKTDSRYEQAVMDEESANKTPIIRLDLSKITKDNLCSGITNFVSGTYAGKTVTFSLYYRYEVPKGTAPFTIGIATDCAAEEVALAEASVIGKDAVVSVTGKMPADDLFLQIGGFDDPDRNAKPFPRVKGTLWLWGMMVTVNGEDADPLAADGDAYKASPGTGYNATAGWFRQARYTGWEMESTDEFFMAFRRIPGAWGQVVKAPKECRFLLMSDNHIDADFKTLSGTTEWYTMWKPHYEALIANYKYVNEHFPELEFALFVGDNINTGDKHADEQREKEVALFWETLGSLNIFKNTVGKDLSAFKLTRDTGPLGYHYGSRALYSAVIPLQGNHDVEVTDFYRNCSFVAGGVKFICYTANYAETAKGNAYIEDATVQFIEREFKAAAEAGIKQTVLVSHYPLAYDTKGFGNWGVTDAAAGCKNDNRQAVIDLCKRYGCHLLLSGHEHCPAYVAAEIKDKNGKPTGIQNVNLCSGTEYWAVAEIANGVLTLHPYTTAVADPVTGKITQPPQPLDTVTVKFGN